MNDVVTKILGNFIVVNNVEIPVEHLKYVGTSKTYITWQLLDEYPSLCANDVVLNSICSLDVDIYSDGNYLSIKNEIIKIMQANDWFWSGNSEEMIDEETGLYHITCSFEIERMI